MLDQLLKDLGINFAVVGFQVAVFVTLFLVMRRLLFEKTHVFMQARDHEIDETRRRIAEERAQVEKLMAEYAARIAAVEKEAGAKLQALVHEGLAAKAKILQEAHDQAQGQLAEARRQIAAAKQQAMADLRAELSRLSHETIEKVLQQKVDAASTRGLIEGALAEFDRRAP